MIYFHYNSGFDRHIFSGQVGDDNLVYNIKTFGWMDMKMVEADGDELDLIRSSLTGIRMSTKQTVRWIGDDAKFIAANWFSIGG